MRRSAMNERDRLILIERRARTQAEARAVASGVAETVALERRRGAVFEAAADEKAADGKRGRERPYRRQPGLDWLVRKGRISEAQRKAGERYRDAYAVAQPTIASARRWRCSRGWAAADRL